nr:hypothetical protein Iba_scaffold43298CG0720 [Ipomoea batatas]
MKKKYLRFRTNSLFFLLDGFIPIHLKHVLCHQLICTHITPIRLCCQRQLQSSWLLPMNPVLMVSFICLIPVVYP